MDEKIVTSEPIVANKYLTKVKECKETSKIGGVKIRKKGNT